MDSIPAGDIIDPKGNVQPWNGWLRGFADDGQKQGGGGGGNYANNRGRSQETKDTGGNMGGQIDDEIPF